MSTATKQPSRVAKSKPPVKAKGKALVPTSEAHSAVPGPNLSNQQAKKPLTREEKLELLELIAERGRRHLIDFTLFTCPGYKAGWFARTLAAKLDWFLDEVAAGRSPRLIIEAPPRHGKTELVSRRLPAYALGRYPDMSFIATSHGADLASNINRAVQRIIDDPRYKELFPDTTLWGSNIRTVADGSYLRNSDEFEVVGHKGAYKSAGVGGGITGRGGDVLIVDDPVKDMQEASSETVRKSIWDWFTSTLYTRGMPGAGILVIMTRWHMDDLAGHLIANMAKGGEQWTVVRYPAIAEEDEEHRKMGEALHPERYPLELLERIKSGTSDEPGVGSKVWSALYQQSPSAAEGNIFKRENWRYLRPPKLLSAMSHEERKNYLRELGVTRVIQRWDTAIGAKKQNDFAACTTLGIAKSRYYVMDVWKDRLQYPDMKKQVELLYDKWHPAQVFVEGGGAKDGKAVVQELGRSTTIAFKEQITSTDKVFRADLVSPSHESGLCTIIEGGGWVADFVDNCANFPNIKHDDDVDSFIGAMEEATQGTQPMQISAKCLQLAGVK